MSLLWALSGCASYAPYQPANVILSDAHQGGSVLAIDYGSRRLASGGLGGRIRLSRLADGDRIATVQAHQGPVTGIGFVPDERRLLSAGYDGVLSLWSEEGERLASVTNESPITAMTVDETERRVFTGHKNGSIKAWRLPLLSPLSAWYAHESGLRALAWHGESRQLASSGHDGRVIVWTAPGSSSVSLPQPPTDARTLAFSDDGRYLFGAGWFKLYRWELANRLLTRLGTEHFGIINAIRFTPEGALASVSRQTDFQVLILDASTGKTLKRLQPHDLCATDVAVSPDGRYLVTSSDDASVMIWDLQNPLPPR